jgi:hypothetical protein
VSLASAVDVPGPTDTVTQAIAAFNSIGLNVNDLTTLLGTNSCHCWYIILYSFSVEISKPLIITVDVHMDFLGSLSIRLL